MKKTLILRIKSALLACALLVLAGVPAAVRGQGTTATLNGIVQDTTGAVIPNAAVELKNEATGDIRRTNSNGSGLFSFTALLTGDYDITIEVQGFTPFKENAIHLDPGDTRSVRDVKLAVRGTSQQVTVEAGGQIISTDSGESSALISAQDIKHLSVEGRDVTELFKVLPGFAINTAQSNAVDNSAYDPSQVTIREQPPSRMNTRMLPALD